MKRLNEKKQLLVFNDEKNIKVIYCFLDKTQLLIQIENGPKAKNVDEIKSQVKDRLISGIESIIETIKHYASMGMPQELIDDTIKIQQRSIDEWQNGEIDIFRIDSFLDNTSTKEPILSLFNVKDGKPELAFQVGPLHSLGLP